LCCFFLCPRLKTKHKLAKIDMSLQDIMALNLKVGVNFTSNDMRFAKKLETKVAMPGNSHFLIFLAVLLSLGFPGIPRN